MQRVLTQHLLPQRVFDIGVKHCPSSGAGQLKITAAIPQTTAH